MHNQPFMTTIVSTGGPTDGILRSHDLIECVIFYDCFLLTIPEG